MKNSQEDAGWTAAMEARAANEAAQAAARWARIAALVAAGALFIASVGLFR